MDGQMCTTTRDLSIAPLLSFTTASRVVALVAVVNERRRSDEECKQSIDLE